MDGLPEAMACPARSGRKSIGGASRPRLDLRAGPRRADGGQEGATVMAKGQKRSNKEPKKPKADKKKALATANTVASTMAKPKAGAVTEGGKR